MNSPIISDDDIKKCLSELTEMLDFISEEKEMHIKYIVNLCDWLPIDNSEDNLSLNGLIDKAECSDTLDESTRRSYSFECLIDAENYVKAEVKAENKWLAVIEINKITTELIRKIK